ncbi:hypothetical protein Bca4012_058584 [Brassica carinata]
MTFSPSSLLPLIPTSPPPWLISPRFSTLALSPPLPASMNLTLPEMTSTNNDSDHVLISNEVEYGEEPCEEQGIGEEDECVEASYEGRNHSRHEKNPSIYGFTTYRVPTHLAPTVSRKESLKGRVSKYNSLVFLGTSKDTEVYSQWEDNMEKWLQSNYIPKEYNSTQAYVQIGYCLGEALVVCELKNGSKCGLQARKEHIMFQLAKASTIMEYKVQGNLKERVEHIIVPSDATQEMLKEKPPDQTLHHYTESSNKKTKCVPQYDEDINSSSEKEIGIMSKGVENMTMRRTKYICKLSSAQIEENAEPSISTTNTPKSRVNVKKNQA